MTKKSNQAAVREGGRASLDDNNNSDRNQNDSKGGSFAGKYQLRPRSMHSRRRCEADWSLQEKRKPKSRPAPLSKYRRKTANTRERHRMRQINCAFEKLREMLPRCSASRRGAASDMTKFTTLRLASAYIKALQEILDANTRQDAPDGVFLEAHPTITNAARQENCSWLLPAGLEDDTPFFQEPQLELYPDRAAVRLPQHRQDGDGAVTDSELASLLCDSSDSGVFEDNLESFSYLSPMYGAEEVALLLLEAETSSSWSDLTYTKFAIS
ncbi:neurogenic differentiation factor 4-like [Penaeus japonicus]|uniref:neurogenic differentiation factor 4-like n=1 Tax=Penaeus japonicus TaxID=27405 RepID=UPI001C7166EE|nr:neurogenic differentiation factor 4-like [Penaeus japonicus]